MKRTLLAVTMVLALAAAVGCGKQAAPETSNDVSLPVVPATPASLNKADYPVFPDADAGADPSVPAEQGGKGFTGKGWETNTDFDFIGDPRALKGGFLPRLRNRFSRHPTDERPGIKYRVQLCGHCSRL